MIPPDTLHTLGLAEAVLALREGRLEPGAYRAACLARARAFEPSIRAFVTLADEDATKDGPLAGMPVAIKDIIATKGLATGNGSPVHAGTVPAEDAWVVGRLRDLGATVLGKTVTTEFAWRYPGPTRNPWNLGHTPGGSSSGSAAAVAAGIVPLALGTQTFGSVIRPAAYCGVVGFKPSYGAIPRAGIHPLAGSLDHVGLFTRSVTDAAFALSLLAAEDEGDRHGRPLPPFAIDPAGWGKDLAPPRLAFVRTPIWSDADADQRHLVEAMADAFGRHGARVDDLVLPKAFDDLWVAARTILAAEASAIFGSLVAAHPDKTSEPLKDLVREGASIPAPTYLAARRLQSDLRREFDTVLADHDAVLTLPAAGIAPEGIAWTGDPAFCVPWTCLGVPAITLPAGEGAAGLPLGLQLVGRYRDDARLLATARWCEASLGRPLRFPPHPASDQT